MIFTQFQSNAMLYFIFLFPMVFIAVCVLDIALYLRKWDREQQQARKAAAKWHADREAKYQATVAPLIPNDTYGPITKDELDSLRTEARSCLSCGMLAEVDPQFHYERYGHQPLIRDADDTFMWSSSARTWVPVIA